MQTKSHSVALLLFDEVELLDVAGPLSVLTATGRHWNWRPFKVKTLATRAGPLATRSQLSISAESVLAQLAAPEIVIVPGGYGARRAVEDAELVAWLKSAGAGAAHVLAIGNGVLLLAKAGLLHGARVVVPEEIRTELLELEPGVSAVPVASDSGASVGVTESGKFATVAASGESLGLALGLVARVLGAKLANATAQVLGIPWLAPEASVKLVTE